MLALLLSLGLLVGACAPVTTRAPSTAAPAVAGVQAPSPTLPAEPPAETLVTAVAEPPAEESPGQRAWEHVRILADDIGPRVAGSAEEWAAIQYAADHLRAWGYDPEIQSFPVRLYDDRGSTLQVEGGQDAAWFTAATLTLAAAGEVEAPLVDAGVGRPSDFQGLDVAGKVALIRRGSLTFGEKVANAAAAGAAAVIVYNHEPGLLQGTLGAPASIPAVSLSG